MAAAAAGPVAAADRAGMDLAQCGVSVSIEHVGRPSGVAAGQDPALQPSDSSAATTSTSDTVNVAAVAAAAISLQATNEIHTTKYTALTFLPRNLFEQFHRSANMFFLALVILNWVPQLNVFGKEVSMMPLLMVLTATAVKDAYEDARRRRNDREVNTSLASRRVVTATHAAVAVSGMSTAPFVARTCGPCEETSEVLWQDLRVGDVVRVQRGQAVPADLLLLDSSDAARICYVSTMNLDGETSLRLRRCLPLPPREEGFGGAAAGSPVLNLKIAAEAPSGNLVGYSGQAVVWWNNSSSSLRTAIQRENLVLRGTILRNTDAVVGVVLYTGHHTKVMLNNSGPPSKRSRLERLMTWDVCALVVILLAMCIGCVAGRRGWLDPLWRRQSLYYLAQPGDDGPGRLAFYAFWKFIIFYQIMVPIALYISLEVMKLGHAYFISQDIDLYDEQTNTRVACRALNLSEDLGQVSHVFSDKTGTMTENKMVFKYAVAGSQLLHGTDVPPLGNSQPLAQSSAGSERAQQRRAEVLRVMALCNTVIPSRCNETPYEGESPDEVALVLGAADGGVRLRERSSHSVLLSEDGQEREYEVLHTLAFDTRRCRMSVLVQDPTGRKWLLCKGADSSVLSLARASCDADEMHELQRLVDLLANQGLRTLCCAQRQLDEAEYRAWDTAYHQALANQDEVQLQALTAQLEQDLDIVGGTAIEDRLAQGVPETIALLQRAGLVVWMLTGDKMGTAIDIGRSARLVPDGALLLRLSTGNASECRHALQQFRLRVASLAAFEASSSQGLSEGAAAAGKTGLQLDVNRCGSSSPPHTPLRSAAWADSGAAVCESSEDDGSPGGWETQVRAAAATLPPRPQPAAALVLVVDGVTLATIFSSGLVGEFLRVAAGCASVICCRSSPAQKAMVVQAVKNQAPNMVTLAIGDGANDVNMIQTAHVGVGISGKEGRQATMASDYALPGMDKLAPLLLVHGHWCYSRLARQVLYFVYKNATFVFLLLWFQPFCGYSGLVPINDYNLIIFSIIYTGFPCIVVGLLDQDVSRQTLMQAPVLYAQGPLDRLYSRGLFWLCIGESLWQSLCLFFVPYFAISGLDVGFWEFGTALITGAVVAANLHLALDTHHWTIFNHILLWGSILVFFVFSIGYSQIRDVPDFFVFTHTLQQPWFWLSTVLSVVLCLMPRFLVQFVGLLCQSTPVAVARVLERAPAQVSPTLAAALPEASTSSLVLAAHASGRRLCCPAGGKGAGSRVRERDGLQSRVLRAAANVRRHFGRSRQRYAVVSDKTALVSGS